MEIDIKYKLYQTVWIMQDNKPKEITLKAFKVNCEYAGYTGDQWGDDCGGKGGYPIRIFYNEENPSSQKKDSWISQHLIFATKEELLKSL